MIRRTKNYLIKRDYGTVTIDVLGLKNIELDAGTYDDIQVFNDSECIYILTDNSGMGYVGLEVLCRDNGVQEHAVFIQNVHDVNGEWLINGKQDIVKINHLLNYCY